jgi:hypothetical protein
MQRRDSLGFVVAFGWAVFYAPCAMANEPAAQPAMSTDAPPPRLIVDRNGGVLDASVAALALLLVATPVAAMPVSLQCTIHGQRAAAYGPLTVVVDPDALSVAIEAPEKMPGIRWEYRNGQVAPVLTQAPPEMMQDKHQPMTMPVKQFVRITRRSVVLGWRTSENDLGQLSRFNRSALDRPGTPCVWHTTLGFDRART